MIILSFIDTLPEKLISYFDKKNIQVSYAKDKEILVWTHILAKEEDFDLIIETFRPIESDIGLIALGSVKEITKFVQVNGKIVIEEHWFDHALSQLFLDKAFYSQGGLALEENYPIFKLNGSFSIVDPFFTNDSLDKLIYDALENKAPAAKVKSYLDHLILYFSHFKSDFKVVFPFDVNYGTFDSVYGVQVSFSSKEILLDELATALNSSEEDPYFYYAFSSTNFLDISYFDDVKKCTITALWSKESKNTSGLLLNEVKQSVNDVHSLIDDSEISLNIFSETNVTDDEKITILKELEVEERSQVETRLHATSIEKDIIQIIKGKVDEEKVSIISGGNNFNVDDFSIKVSSGLEEKASGNDIFKVKALKSELPDAIKERFIIFSQENNINLDDIQEHHIEAFKEKEIPNLIRIKTKEIDERYNDGKLSKENLFLKKKMQTLLNEVKFLKEEKLNAQKLQKQVSIEAEKEFAKIEALPANAQNLEEMIHKMNQQKFLDEADTSKLAELLENETKYIREIKEADLKIRKQNIESNKQESVFAAEIEKLNRQLKAKELIVSKTKDSFTRLLEKRDIEISQLKDRVGQMTNSLLNKGEGDKGKVLSLEKQLQNAQRLADIYKSKLAQKPQVSAVVSDSRDEVRKLTAVNNQLKNQLTVASKEVQKLDFKLREQLDFKKKLEKQVVELKTDNQNMITQNEVAVSTQNETAQDMTQPFVLELQEQLKESIYRQKELEEKLIEAIKSKMAPMEVDNGAKAKAMQAEASMKKLTVDLGESRAQIQKMKQEIQKLRSEKTALQNAMERSKKELDKLKASAKKTA